VCVCVCVGMHIPTVWLDIEDCMTIVFEISRTWSTACMHVSTL